MQQPLTLYEHVRGARRRLEGAGIERPEAALDAELLARHALGGWEHGQLLAAWRDAAPPGFLDAFDALVRRRERREPTAYITGRREFWNIEIAVAPGVLIPRPETEFIIEEVLGRVPEGQPSLRIADVGTGSGCLAVALARWLPSARIVATDVSAAALAIAAQNAARLAVSDRVSFVSGDLLDGTEGAFDVIVSNPPYVPSDDIARLQPEVRDFEPTGALDGGVDGLDLIRRLVPHAAGRLTPGGWLVFEFGFGQTDGVRAIIDADQRLALVAVRDDLAGIPRVAVVRCRHGWPGPNPESRVPSPE